MCLIPKNRDLRLRMLELPNAQKSPERAGWEYPAVQARLPRKCSTRSDFRPASERGRVRVLRSKVGVGVVRFKSCFMSRRACGKGIVCF